MEKKTYQVLSGDTFEVEASSGKEALEKYYAYSNGEECPCSEEDCTCVSFGEASTILLDADPEA
jgi:hypothetical protein